MTQALKVLIVDDDRTNIVVLKTILERYHYETAVARNGAEAVQMYEQSRPDIILMDVMMPVMDGYEATRQIKKLTAGQFVPVIFLTAVTEENALAECVRSGGDDFITKPYNHIILKSKIDAMLRIREMTSTITKQNLELSFHQERLRKEQEIAEKIFSNIVRAGYIDISNLKYYVSPMAVFNGDLLLYAIRPTGALHVLVGDFTGHGLSAAVGAVPVSDMFYTMTSNGFTVSDIAAEINGKLYDILPTDHFFACAVMEIDCAQHTLTVWNGGMPDILVMRPGQGVTQRAISQYLPMGILPPARFKRSAEVHAIAEGDKVYAYSDGVTELADGGGKMLRQAGLELLLTEHLGRGMSHQEIVAGLRNYALGTTPADDITLVEICIAANWQARSQEREMRLQRDSRPMNWSIDIQLEKPMLKSFDPLPLLNKSIMDLQGLHAHKEKIYTILSELISNAIDHGILGLDSSMRETSRGFAAYYNAREQLLSNTAGGKLRVLLEHRDVAGKGELRIKVEDSGAGFDVDHIDFSTADHKRKSGRGIPMVRALSKQLRYYNGGSGVEAVYEWQVKGSADRQAAPD